MCGCENLLVLRDLKYDKCVDGQVFASQTQPQWPYLTGTALLPQARIACTLKVSGLHLPISEWSTYKQPMNRKLKLDQRNQFDY